jgi:protein phosphatase
VSGSGKSTFAHTHFKPTEVLSSDFCRGLVADDENDQSASQDAFDLLNVIAAKRLSQRRLTVIDATNVRPEARRSLLALARRYHCPAVALVLDLPESVCQARDQARPDRQVGRLVIARQLDNLRHSLTRLEREGFWRTYVLRSVEEAAAVTLVRQPLQGTSTPIRANT